MRVYVNLYPYVFVKVICSKSSFCQLGVQKLSILKCKVEFYMLRSALRQLQMTETLLFGLVLFFKRIKDHLHNDDLHVDARRNLEIESIVNE